METSLSDQIMRGMLVLVPMILSLTVHEFAHAWVARLLGDDTAQRMGRLNLNPLSHIDPVGTIILPLAILTLGGMFGAGVPFFGWAKPVPVNAGLFTRKMSVRTGMMLVAAAGPLSNLLMALACALVLGFAVPQHVLADHAAWVMFLVYMVKINVVLAVFNMLPFYPLDGQKVVAGFLRGSKALSFERFSYRYGTVALFAVIFFAHDVIAYPVQVVSGGLFALVGL